MQLIESLFFIELNHVITIKEYHDKLHAYPKNIVNMVK